MGERRVEALDVPWARRAPARIMRGAVLMGLLGPAMDLYTEIMERVRAFFEQAGTKTTLAERSSVLAGAGAP